MEMSGEHTISAPRQAVWDALNDPEVLKACIPGCETLEKTSDTEMTATVTAKDDLKTLIINKAAFEELDAIAALAGRGGAAVRDHRVRARLALARAHNRQRKGP